MLDVGWNREITTVFAQTLATCVVSLQGLTQLRDWPVVATR